VSYIDFWERLDFKFGDWGSKEYFELVIASNFLSGKFYYYLDIPINKKKINDSEAWQNFDYILNLPKFMGRIKEDIPKEIITLKKYRKPRVYTEEQWEIKKQHERINTLRRREREEFLKTLPVEDLLIEVGYYEEIEIQEESQAVAEEEEILPR